MENEIILDRKLDIVVGGIGEISVTAGTAKISEIIADRGLVFGQCYANKFECQAYDISDDISMLDIDVFSTENGERKQLFHGKIETSETDKYSLHRDIVAYDDFYWKREDNIADWWNGFWESRQFAMLKSIRQSLLEYIGIQENDVPLVNDNFVIKNGTKFTNIKFGEMFKMITELQACIPNIGRNGVMEYVVWGSGETHNLSDRYEGLNVEFEDYNTNTITGIQVYADESALSQTVGNETNPYSIVGNIFLLNMSVSEIDEVCLNMLSAINSISYSPAKIPMIVSDLDIKIGDLVLSENGTHYVMANHLSGSLLVEQTIEAPAFGIDQSKTQQTMNTNMIIGRKFSKIESDIDHFGVQIEDIQQNYTKNSEFQQTIDGINAKVESIESEVEGTILVYYTTEEPTLLNYPAWDFTFSIPCNGTVQLGDGVPFEYKPEWYQKFLRTVVFDEKTSQTYKFAIDTNTREFYWMPAADSEFGVAMQKIAELDVRANEITSRVEENTLSIANQDEVLESHSSRITQTAKDIFMEVINGRDNAVIKLTVKKEDGSIAEIISKTIKFTGDVVFASDLTDGKTIISGDNVRTGEIISNNFEYTEGPFLDQGMGISLNDGGIYTKNFSIFPSGNAYFRGDILASSIYGGSIISANIISIKDNLATYINEGVIHTSEIFLGFLGQETARIGFQGGLGSQGDSVVIDKLLVGDAALLFDESFYVYGDAKFKGSIKVNEYYPVIYSEVVNSFSISKIHYYARGVYFTTADGSNYFTPVDISDTRLKENIKSTQVCALEKMLAIDIISYDWKDGSGHVELGLSANQLQEIIPSAVGDIAQGEESEFETLKQINSNELVHYSIKAIQELNAKIEEQQNEIDELKAMVNALLEREV